MKSAFVATLVATAAGAFQSAVQPQRSHRCGAVRLNTATAKNVWTDISNDAMRLTDAQTARTVGSVSAEGMLCTQAAVVGAEPGTTFACATPFVTDESGCPLLPLDSAEASTNLAESTLATYYVRAPRGGAASRSAISLIGSVESYASDELTDAQLMQMSAADGASVEELAARKWVRLVPSRVHLRDAVRGTEAWVAPSDYASAEPNPLGAEAAGLLTKINTQHTEALRRFAAVYAGVSADDLTDAAVLGVDHLGFDLRMQLGESAPPSLMRIGFKMPPANQEEGTSLFMKLFQEAYERQAGFM